MKGGREVGTNLILKDEVGDILQGLAFSGSGRGPGYYAALVSVALALGLLDVAQEVAKLKEGGTGHAAIRAS